MRRALRYAWVLGVLAVVGGSVLHSYSSADASGSVSFYGRNATYQDNQINGAWGAYGWHGYSYAEEALDLFVGTGLTARFRADALASTLYWSSSGYGVEGGGTSQCTGRVYTLSVYDASLGYWKALIQENIVHLNAGMHAYGSGYVSPYSSYEDWAGIVADSQPGCTYDPHHIHYSRSTSYGSSAHNGAPGFGAAWSWVGSSEVVFVAYD